MHSVPEILVVLERPFTLFSYWTQRTEAKLADALSHQAVKAGVTDSEFGSWLKEPYANEEEQRKEARRKMADVYGKATWPKGGAVGGALISVTRLAAWLCQTLNQSVPAEADLSECAKEIQEKTWLRDAHAHYTIYEVVRAVRALPGANPQEFADRLRTNAQQVEERCIRLEKAADRAGMKGYAYAE